MIAIVDYGAGNLCSVQNAFRNVGAQFEVVREAERLRHASKVVLPGVGHFGAMMRALDVLALRDAITRNIRDGLPFLGVCRGMQALFEGRAEAPEIDGLKILCGRVERFTKEVRVPHMGWNEIKAVRSSRCLTNGYVYFAHSYYAPICEEAVATCYYSQSFTAAIEKDNCFGVQFHPEKSGALGLGIVRSFAEL